MTTHYDSIQVQDLDVTGDMTIKGVKVGDLDMGPQAAPAVFDDSEATTVKQLVEDFNSLLGVLRGANVIA